MTSDEIEDLEDQIDELEGQIQDLLEGREERNARIGQLESALRDCHQMADELHRGTEYTFPADIRRRAEIVLEGAGEDHER